MGRKHIIRRLAFNKNTMGSLANSTSNFRAKALYHYCFVVSAINGGVRRHIGQATMLWSAKNLLK
jgi:hypothetical protein